MHELEPSRVVARLSEKSALTTTDGAFIKDEVFQPYIMGSDLQRSTVVAPCHAPDLELYDSALPECAAGTQSAPDNRAPGTAGAGSAGSRDGGGKSGGNPPQDAGDGIVTSTDVQNKKIEDDLRRIGNYIRNLTGH